MKPLPTIMGYPLILVVSFLCLTILFITMLIVPESDDGFEIVAINSLDRHNFYREKHNVSLLKISEKLNKVSQYWANELAKKDKFVHNHGIYGENIYMTVFSKTKDIPYGAKAVNAFYDEKKYFDFYGTEKEMIASNKAFHLTQVLWKNSKELGQGCSRSLKTNKIYIVCNYYPRGNVLNTFKENVFPPKNT